MNELPVAPVNWQRDMLPQLLWIAALVHKYGPVKWYPFFSEFLDSIQKYADTGTFVFGLLSDFDQLNELSQKKFLEEQSELIQKNFIEPFGDILKLYPNAPGSWLITDQVPVEQDEQEISRLSEIVAALLDRQSAFACVVEAGLFIRVLTNGRIKIPRDSIIASIGPRYPGNCSKDERDIFHGCARAFLNTGGNLEFKHCFNSRWPSSFWNHNANLVECSVLSAILPEEETKTDSPEQFIEIANQNIQLALKHIDDIRVKVKLDLFEPESGEVMFGLFSRICRLYVTTICNSQIAVRDIGGIILRCLAESVIIFAYLSKKASKEEMQKFIQYADGKEKLRLLHLQDTYPDDSSIGRSASDVARGLGGGFGIEIIDIDLANWTK
jgi:hypothetical protein